MQYTTELRRHMHGNLEVLVDQSDGTELFTFASLADVLDLPPSTLEGRYARTGLKELKQDIRNNAGRPVRCFPLHMLDEVITILTTPGAQVTVNRPRVMQHGQLQSTIVGVHRYYTPQQLADNYGVTVTTIRNRLKAGNLLRLMVPIPGQTRAGRPAKGYRHEDISAVLEHLDKWAGFRTTVPPITIPVVLPPPSDGLPGKPELAAAQPVKPSLPTFGATAPARADHNTALAQSHREVTSEEFAASIAELEKELEAELAVFEETAKRISTERVVNYNAPRRVLNRLNPKEVWERDPSFDPGNDLDRWILRDCWYSYFCEYLDAQENEKPGDPSQPYWLDRMRLMYEKYDYQFAHKRWEKHAQAKRALEKELRQAFAAKDLAQAQAVQQRIDALPEPERIIEPDEFIQHCERLRPLAQRIWDVALGPDATMFNVVEIPGVDPSLPQGPDWDNEPETSPEGLTS